MSASVPNLFLLWWVILLAGCSGTGNAPQRPELPGSIAPGWTQQSVMDTAPPVGLPATGAAPRCWLALYQGPGKGEVRVCGYRSEGPAFDALQRFPSAANTVKFQQREWFVLVQWSGASQTDATALVRGIQRALAR